MVIVGLAASAALCPTLPSAMDAQHEPAAAYVGTWKYVGQHVEFTLTLRADGTGYLADEVDTFPFEYSLDVGRDPARLDLVYEVDMAFGRVSHTLVRLERTGSRQQLHWVSMHSERGPPEWPEDSSGAAAGVTWITFQRVGS